MKMCRRMAVTAMAGSVMFACTAWTGDLTPPGAPGPTMHTLEEIYQKLAEMQLSLEAAGIGPVNVPAGMALIPAGSFQMGDNFGEGSTDERPVNSLTVSSFLMDKFEVTNEDMRQVFQWAYDQGLVGATTTTVTNSEGDLQELLDLDDPDCQISFSGGTFGVDTGKTNFPCVEVSWCGAQAYCNYRSDMVGRERCVDFSVGAATSRRTGTGCRRKQNGRRRPVAG